MRHQPSSVKCTKERAMSAHLSPDVEVAIARQRRHETQFQANRWHLTKLIEPGRVRKAHWCWTQMNSALLTRAGAVLLSWPRRTAGRSEHNTIGPIVTRYQA